MTKIVTVHGFRGGTGVTTVAANLGVLLALKGRRVGIVDVDLQAPGLHVLFNLRAGLSGRTLNDVLWQRCPIGEAAHAVGDRLVGSGGLVLGHVCVVPCDPEIDAIMGVLRGGYDLARLTGALADLVGSGTLDYVVIDTHPGLEEESLLAMSIADRAMILMSPDRQHFQGTAVVLALARRLRVPVLDLLVNKVASATPATALRREVERSYSTPVAAMLPLCDDLAGFGSDGIFCLSAPDHPWTQEMRRLVDQVVAG